MITYLILHRVFLFLCIINFIFSLIFGVSYAELKGRLTRITAIISTVVFIISGILTIIFGTLYEPNPCFHITN
jgi:hypothetical protein